MTKVTAKSRQGRQAAGKHPTRVPKRTSSPPQPTATTKQTRTSKRRTRLQQPSAHRMTTRSRAKSFQFMNLPPELRSLVYGSVFSSADQPLDLSSFKLPKLLSVSRTVREEALPVFFAASTFTTTFRSNWCVRNKHWHSSEYMRHFDTGKLNLSAFLVEGNLALPQEAVRFHNANFSVRCVCCIQPIEIGSVQLRVIGRKPFVNTSVTSTNLDTKLIWPGFVQDLEREVKTIGQREHFNGFSTKDLQELAMCFRYSPEPTHG